MLAIYREFRAWASAGDGPPVNWIRAWQWFKPYVKDLEMQEIPIRRILVVEPGE
jgi:hypothetical protein